MTTTQAKTDTQRIAELNDLCRKAIGVAGRVFQTQGISALPQHDQSAIREKVELFDDFTPDNDPYGEHDFGAFDHEGEKIFWKIDYYAPDMEHGSENPADPLTVKGFNHHAGQRVLTEGEGPRSGAASLLDLTEWALCDFGQNLKDSTPRQ
jgi:Protein of unknown function (DUF3768)